MALDGGWAAAPLTDALRDACPPVAAEPRSSSVFDFAPLGLHDFLSAITRDSGPLAYIETEYFGGTGDQSGGAWAKGKLLRVDRGRGSINAALHAIGVRDAPGLDAFDTIGLGRRRRMDDYEAEESRRYSAAASPSPPAKPSGLPIWVVVAVLSAAIGLGLAAALIV
jgi:hypothetical protein